MSELIVALDGPSPCHLGADLARAGVRWFKIGPQAMACGQWDRLILAASGINIFVDLKLADTEDTVRETARRFADAGVTAISTFTDNATWAAMEGGGDRLRVWRVMRLTDSKTENPGVMGNGIICPVADLPDYAAVKSIDRVCPGIRLPGQDQNGHKFANTPNAARNNGCTHIVVGRPIWQANDPIKMAREFLGILDG